MEQCFTNAYENMWWGNNNITEYSGSSGCGSTINYNEDTYIPFLKKFITDNNIKNIVDLGCGDFRCGKLIYDDLDILYTGYDAYKKIIDYNSNQYRLIIVQNKNYILLHFKNILNNQNKIYKIYKNKFIL